MRHRATFDAWGVIMNASHNPASLAQQHVAFARVVARRLSRTLPAYADFDALESDALLGLVLAARSFDPTRGVAFTTYAAKRIHGAMLDGLRDRQGCRRGDSPPAVFSLDALFSSADGRTTSLADLLAGDEEPVGAAMERRDTIQQLLRQIDGRSRELLSEHYLEGRSQEDIARDLGLTASRVSQRIGAARRQLRETFCLCAN